MKHLPTSQAFSDEPPLTMARKPARFASLLTRMAALCTLFAVSALLAYLVMLAYRAFTDAYIAPLILSPENDLVLDYKQKVLELDVQRSLAVAQAEAIDADLAETTSAEKRLTSLYAIASGSLRYTSEVNSTEVGAGNRELAQLDAQRELLTEIHNKQSDIAARAAANFKSGLLTRGDYDREQQTLRQTELTVLENSRARAAAEAKMDEAMLGKSSLARRGGATPELLSREAQMVQVQLELLRMQAETRAKRAERSVLKEQIERIEDLQAQLHHRPIFKAMERSLYAAFIPYTQLESVTADADIFRCQFGFFFCHWVGRVAAIVPGEVSAPDPWGNPARGQYLLLDLLDARAATAKVLRVRPPRRPS